VDAGRILVVDDDARNRALVRAFLQGGLTILEAASGPEALDLAAREPVDLVLLDVMLPGMSGFEVCRELKRRTEREVLLPVILVTALGEQVDRNAGLEAGADDYLAKPVDRHELRLRVNAFLRLRRQEGSLREQFEQLQHLAALKDDLFSLMVHDLRNPLASVIALLQVIEDDVADPELEADARDARAAAARIADALDDIMRISLLEEKKLALDLQPYPASGIVREALASVGPAAREAGVELELDSSADAPVPADRKLVRRAVENLLTNAVRYSPRPGRVEVGVRPEDGGVEIGVADRGPGVPELLREALFEKFGSVEAARGHARRGHGLGLYLVKLVAAAHGGRATARAREGGGSVFGLWLPASREGR
jgi:signal transduction histidine kinase